MPANSSDSRPERAEDRHHRTALFYGEAGLRRIRGARAVVVGLGGVGGHAAVNLARTGIGALHLVDFDAVTPSSLNRSAYAEPTDVGRPKTEVLAAWLARVCPDVAVTFETVRCDPDNVTRLVAPEGRSGELVLDAIDSVADKIALLAGCHSNQIPVFSSMGAAAKRDVSQVQTGRLGDSKVCPLARAVRVGLRNRKVPLDLPCVWSIEPVRPDLQRPLPSQMSLPGVFGYALASLALDHLTANPDTETNHEENR